MKLRIMQGDVFTRIKEISDNSIDLCITSPPYWGLRDYGVGGQLGNEPSMEEYLDNTMRWVKEVWRVLKPSGNFVLNIGDCFIGGGRGTAAPREADKGIMKSLNESIPKPPSWRELRGNRKTGKLNGEEFSGGHRGQAPPPNWKDLKENGTTDRKKANSTPHAVGAGNLGGIYKTKQLLSVSSFAYCRIVSETDFVCRGEHIWAKPNVPSPIRSRLKHSHEKLFWFVKDANKNYFDKMPWMKKIKETSKEKYENPTSDSPPADSIGLSPTSCYRGGQGRVYLKEQETIEHSWRIVPVGAKQSGFELAGKQASEHIAPYPEELIRPYIKSLCPQDGVVLDPFLGSGTTMRVAMEEQLDSIGIEINEKSIKYAKKRLNWGQGLDCEYEEVVK